MVSKSIRSITGESTDYAAWDAIFCYFNQQQGKGGGYIAGPSHDIQADVPMDNMLALIDVLQNQTRR
jgi:hypothetical protein